MPLASEPQNVIPDLCTQWRLRSVCASSQSLLSAWWNAESLTSQNAHSEDSYQTARMRRLIWIFVGRTCPNVRFLTLRLIWCDKHFNDVLLFCCLFLLEVIQWHVYALEVKINDNAQLYVKTWLYCFFMLLSWLLFDSLEINAIHIHLNGCTFDFLTS